MNKDVYLQKDNYMEKKNCLSKITFAWFVKICKLGLKRHLELYDICKAPLGDNSDEISKSLEKNWKVELEKSKKQYRNPNLMSALIRTFWGMYLTCGIIQFVQYSILIPWQPIILGRFLITFDTIDKENRYIVFYQMCWYGGILVATSILLAFVHNHLVFITSRIGVKVKVSCACLVYKKVLKLSQKSIHETVHEDIIELISKDLRHFDEYLSMLHLVWITPFQCVITIFLIWQTIGLPGLIGVFVFLSITLPLNFVITKVTKYLKDKADKKTDERVNTVHEIVSEIKLIKTNGLEKPFEKKVEIVRKEEMKLLTLVAYIKGILSSTSILMQRVIVFITSLFCVLFNVVLTSDKVFPMLQYCTILQTAIMDNFPKSLNHISEARATLVRLEQFLRLEEIFRPIIRTDMIGSVTLKNVKASWNSKNYTLANINARVHPGNLCAVIGLSGSGKTSLFQLLCGELIQESGSVKIGGTLSYATQEPWIFVSSIRNNILFGQTYEKVKYRRVIEACQLENDFKELTLGDETLLGTIDTQLSYTQLLRIHLARSLYRDADIYLLDSCLSVSNVDTENNLFEKCILGYLKDKTRIFTTNNVGNLSKADQIIVLNNGKVTHQGNYDELKKLTNFNLESVVTKVNYKKQEYFTTIVTSTVVPSVTKMNFNEISLSTKELTESTHSQPTCIKSSCFSCFSGLIESINKYIRSNSSYTKENLLSSFNSSGNTVSSSVGEILQTDNEKKTSTEKSDEKETLNPLESAKKSLSSFLPSKKFNSYFEEMVTNKKLLNEDKEIESSQKGHSESSKSKSKSEEQAENASKVVLSKISGGTSYLEHFKSGGSIMMIIKLFILLILAQAVSNLADYWLTIWTKEDTIRNLNCEFGAPRTRIIESFSANHDLVINVSLRIYYPIDTNSNHSMKNMTEIKELCASLIPINLVMFIYTVLIILSALLLIYRTIYYYKMLMKASDHLHSKMIGSLLESPISNFEDKAQHNNDVDNDEGDENNDDHNKNSEEPLNNKDDDNETTDVKKKVEYTKNSKLKTPEKSVSFNFFQKLSSNEIEDCHESLVASVEESLKDLQEEKSEKLAQHSEITNNFSENVKTVDNDLPDSMLDTIQGYLVSIGIFFTIIFVNPYLIVCTIVIVLLIYKVRGWYMAIETDLKLAENETKQSIFLIIGDSLRGIVQIRASKLQKVLIKEFEDHQDIHTAAWFLVIACTSAFGLWIDLLSIIYTLAAVITFIYISQVYYIQGSYVGLAITQSLFLAGVVRYANQSSSKTNQNMNSKNKIIKSTQIKNEEDFGLLRDLDPDWPREGRIKFTDVSLRYSIDKPLALNNITCKIEPGKKIGIIGVPGSGKTSLINCILRLVKFEGSLSINDIDIRTISLRNLRQKVSLIPQNPNLFNETLRFNLDPANEYSDLDVWRVLETVELVQVFKSLDIKITKKGQKYSTSQKQLLCLARALLRNNKIVIIDNGLENVNTRTHALIMRIIKTKFVKSTVLIVDKKLETVIELDKVMVLDKGVIVEFDFPYELLKNKESKFSKMVSSAIGDEDLQDLANKAEKEFLKDVIEIIESVTEYEETIYFP